VAQGLKRTPLYAVHRRAGGKMVEFAGWEMPLQYSGLVDEHVAVRSRAGLFDVSHMGQLEVRGSGGLEFCQRVSANDVARMELNQAQYNLLLHEQGGIVDDVIFYRLEAQRFLICVNAANIEKDFDWLRHQATGNIEIADLSTQYALLALQGPLAEKILQPLTTLALRELKRFRFRFTELCSAHCLVSRTGYTGEDGFEIYCDPAAAEMLWTALLNAGADDGLLPAGLGARDTLRLEMGYPLYGHELDDTTTPMEAGLEWVVKLSKPVFVGREVLARQKSQGPRRRLIGLELIEPGIARSGYELYRDGRAVGRITSGTKSPTLGKSIALGYVSLQALEGGEAMQVEIRGRKVQAKVVSLPFVRH
jgi:aminomethyltransferase